MPMTRAKVSAWMVLEIINRTKPSNKEQYAVAVGFIVFSIKTTVASLFEYFYFRADCMVR